jgi:hypothetical protein
MSNATGNYINKIFPEHKFHIAESTKQYICWICDNCHSEIIWCYEQEEIEDACDKFEIPNDCKPYEEKNKNINH